VYFYKALKEIKNLNTFYWPSRQISTYDIFDDTKPDIFITHVGAMDYDLGVYLEDNKISDKLLILLATFNNQPKEDKEYFQQIEESINSKIKKNLFLLSDQDLGLKTIKTIKMNHCADISVIDQKLKYQIPVAYFVDNNKDINKEKEKSYHYISNTIAEADICLEQISLARLFNNYNKIVFKNIKMFSQCFFDALYRCKEVYYTTEDRNIDEHCEKLFGQVLNINNNNVNFEKVKQRVLEKHLPKNRIKSLLSQIPINQNIFTEV
jgi:hypothetical protein